MAIWKVGGSSGSDRERRLSPHIQSSCQCLPSCVRKERKRRIEYKQRYSYQEAMMSLCDSTYLSATRVYITGREK